MQDTIAIIGGTGALGKALAWRWAKAGYNVVIAARDAEKGASLLEALRKRVPPGARLRCAGYEEACAAADVVVLSVPYGSCADVLKQLSPLLAGKLLIVPVVPLRPPHVGRVELPAAGSAAVEAQRLVGDSTEVVGAFHNIAAGLLDSDAHIAAEVLVTGNSAEARQRVIALAAAAGLQAWHAGPLANTAAAEALTSVLIHLNKKYGLHASGIRIVSDAQADRQRHAPDRVEVFAIKGIPKVEKGDDLPALILERIRASATPLLDGDVLVVAQKIISKAEGRMVLLDDVVPTPEAVEMAQNTDKDPRIVQLILDESAAVLRTKRGVIIVEHRLGHVLANAGVDQSNVPQGYALLLPLDPDESARRLRDSLMKQSGKNIAVIVSDSIGRAWRNGTVGHALGVAGLSPLADLRGAPDMMGRPLQSTQVAIADAIAAAAVLVMGEKDEMKPAVLVRGYLRVDDHSGISPLLRNKNDDLFR